MANDVTTAGDLGTPWFSNPDKETRDELEQALSNSVEKNLVFPLDLAEIDHWAAFRIHQQEFRRAEDFPIKKSGTNIFLPMPLGLQTQYTQSYNSEGIGPAGAAGARTGGNIANGGIRGLVDSLKNVSTREVTNAAGYYAVQGAEENVGAIVGAAVGGIGGAVVGAAAGQFLKGAIAGAGISRNPYMSVMYDSPAFRTHSFTWKLVPRNQKESDILQKIIYMMKYHSAPGKAENNHFFTYPEQFDIDFHYSKYLFNIGPSVLTEFSVNYHSDGQPLYHEISEFETQDVGTGRTLVSTDKAPVSIEISASFQEVAILDKDLIKKQGR